MTPHRLVGNMESASLIINGGPLTMHPATAGTGRNSDQQPSETLPLRQLVVIAAVGYGLFTAVMTGLFMLPGLLDPTLSGNAGAGRFGLLLGLAAILGVAIGAIATVATHRNETKTQNAPHDCQPAGPPY